MDKDVFEHASADRSNSHSKAARVGELHAELELDE